MRPRGFCVVVFPELDYRGLVKYDYGDAFSGNQKGNIKSKCDVPFAVLSTCQHGQHVFSSVDRVHFSFCLLIGKVGFCLMTLI